MTATIKCTLVLSLMTLLVGVATPTPYHDYYVDLVTENEGGYGLPRYGPIVMLQGSRGFWDFLGNWIQDSNWLPVEINIPDTFGSITSGISNFTTGIIQRIPFLNNNNNNNQNGPKPFMLLFPMFRTRITTKAAMTPIHENPTGESTEANHPIVDSQEVNDEQTQNTDENGDTNLEDAIQSTEVNDVDDLNTAVEENASEQVQFGSQVEENIGVEKMSSDKEIEGGDEKEILNVSPNDFHQGIKKRSTISDKEINGGDVDANVSISPKDFSQGSKNSSKISLEEIHEEIEGSDKDEKMKVSPKDFISSQGSRKRSQVNYRNYDRSVNFENVNELLGEIKIAGEMMKMMDEYEFGG